MIVNILLLVITVFSIMSFASLRKISKQHNSDSNIPDDRYYELKYKLQFISTVGVIIIGVGGFFGYDKYDKFIEKFEGKNDTLSVKLKDFDKRISSMDSVMKSYDGKIDAYDSFLTRLNKNKNSLSADVTKTNKQLASLTDTISIIQKRNILDKSFYVIDGLKLINNSTIQRFYFKDLNTIIGDKLPIFEKKPVLFLIPQGGATIIIKTVTTEYVEIGVSGYTSFEDDDPQSFLFGLLISRRQL